MTVVVAYLTTVEGRQALLCAAREAVDRQLDLVVVGDVEHGELGSVLGPELLAEVTARVRIESGTGDIAEDLVETAERRDAELVVIGLRRRSPVGKLVLGAGAQRILLEAPCPVLAVTPSRENASGAFSHR